MTNKDLCNTDSKESNAFIKISEREYKRTEEEKNKLNNQINEIYQNNSGIEITNKLLAIMINELFDIKNEIKDVRKTNSFNHQSTRRIQLSLNEIGNKMSDTLDTIQLLQ